MDRAESLRNLLFFYFRGNHLFLLRFSSAENKAMVNLTFSGKQGKLELVTNV